MKSIIFANGDPHAGTMVQRVLDQASEALIIAADGGVRVADFFEIPLDIVIGDMDSVDLNRLAELAQTGVEVQQHPAEKKQTDLELALLLAVERGADWIRIVGGVGDRLDQTLSNVYLTALPELRTLDVRLVSGEQEAWLLQDHETHIHGQAGDTLSLLPLTGEVTGVKTENLYYPLEYETLYFGPARGISNVLKASHASVRVDNGVLLVIHTVGRA